MGRAVRLVVLLVAACSGGAADAGGTDPDGGRSLDAGEARSDAGRMPDGGQADAGADADGGRDAGGDGGPFDGGPTTALTMLDIQLDLENRNGGRGDYPSCIDGPGCHADPARNVVLVSDPTFDELLQNWRNIVNAGADGTPWVTPPDERAQMLNEVGIPAPIRARWLEWIEAGAPFN